MFEHYKNFGIQEEVITLCKDIEGQLQSRFKEIDEVAEINQLKVLKAMQEHKVSDRHFSGTTGYGYNDEGRDVLEDVYASVFGAESALVRPQLISGTHALTVALFGNLRHGDEILSAVGAPYDTLQGVIGMRETPGSLAEHGVTYSQVDFLNDGSIDFEGIREAINERTKLVTIQRSRGYSTRKTLSVAEIKQIIETVKAVREDIICMVDNCYGEFVEMIEPYEVGADLVVGSLIKNIGGGLAPIGGYIVGKEAYVEQAAYRLTAPGLGKEVGASLGVNQSFYQGLFLAPQVVAGALKGAIFAAALFEKFGYKVFPDSIQTRHDIVQAINLESADAVISFCKGIQAAAPVDSYVVPEPWAMPGYDCPVIMAAGAFIQGASIELSADAPIKPPYTVFFQGGLTWFHAKLGIMKAVQTMVDDKTLEI